MLKPEKDPDPGVTEAQIEAINRVLNLHRQSLEPKETTELSASERSGILQNVADDLTALRSGSLEVMSDPSYTDQGRLTAYLDNYDQYSGSIISGILQLTQDETITAQQMAATPEYEDIDDRRNVVALSTNAVVAYMHEAENLEIGQVAQSLQDEREAPLTEEHIEVAYLKLRLESLTNALSVYESFDQLDPRVSVEFVDTSWDGTKPPSQDYEPDRQTVERDSGYPREYIREQIEADLSALSVDARREMLGNYMSTVIETANEATGDPETQTDDKAGSENHNTKDFGVSEVVISASDNYSP